MKIVFYFFIIAQILNFLGLIAEKVTENSPEFNCSSAKALVESVVTSTTRVAKTVAIDLLVMA